MLAFVLGTAIPAVNYFGLLLLLLTGPVDRMLPRRKAEPNPCRFKDQAER